MAVDSENVRVAVTGALSYAPIGTALPTDATTALNAAFKDVGYIDTNGIARAHSVDTNDIVAWQNADLVRKVATKDTLTYKFSMLESNDNSRTIYYGNVDGTTKAAHGVGGIGIRGCWVIDVVDGADLIRKVIPDAQVTDWDDQTLASGDAVMYGVTLTAYPDSSGNKDYEYVA